MIRIIGLVRFRPKSETGFRLSQKPGGFCDGINMKVSAKFIGVLQTSQFALNLTRGFCGE
jgi:hypothetical protein